MSWVQHRLRDERGIAMVLVVFAIAVLSTVSVVLVNTVTDESGRSAKSVVRQSSFEAAESGLDDYIAKLADDRQYYLHWVHPAESTRKDVATTAGGTGTTNLISPSGSSPAPSTWCRDPKTKPDPIVWNYGTAWNNKSQGKDHWCSLGNGYEYNLQITPPSATQTGVTIVATVRKIPNLQFNTSDTRVIEAVVKQSSITDFQEIADGDIGWASGATAYGLIYSNSDITWNGGTAYGSNFAVGSVTGSVTWMNGATGFDESSSTSYTNLFAPPSPLTGPIDFNTFLASFSDISSASKDTTGGGIYLDSSYNSWRLTFNSNGTVKVEGCSSATPQTSSTSPTCTTVNAAASVPANGAIYSDVSVIVQGTVRGRVTLATPNRIIIGGNLLYSTDAGNLLTDADPAIDVLGLESMNEIVIPCWITGNIDWHAALLSETQTWGAWGNTGWASTSSGCSTSPASNNRMRHRGSATVEHGGSFSGWFDNRDYYYDSTLPYLAPPWFPTIDPAYNIVSFRELPARLSRHFTSAAATVSRPNHQARDATGRYPS